MLSGKCVPSVLLVVTLLGLPVLGFAGETTHQAEKVLSVGNKATNFTLEDFRGERFTVSDANGRAGVLLWFTNLCDGCRAKFAQVEKFRKDFDGKGVQFIAISRLGKDRKTVEEAIRTNHLTVRFLYDPKGEVTTRYSGDYVPGTCPLTNLYLIDKNDTIVYATHYLGVPEEEIASQLTDLRVTQLESK